MSLTQWDINYRDNANIRIAPRLFIAVSIGMFASWPWLFGLVAAYGLAESFTAYKVLTHSADGDPITKTPEVVGQTLAVVLARMSAATLGTLTCTITIKAIKIGVVWILR